MAAETERTDDELVTAIAAHDAAAMDCFAQFYDRHHRAAFALASRILGGDHALAEDAVQEAFLALWRFAGGFIPARGAARTWFMSIVHHRALNALRRLKPERWGGSLDDMAERPATDDAYDVWRQVTHGLDAAAVRAALAQLPEEQRAAIALSFLGGLSNTEVAARLDLPLGTVKSRIRLGMQKLRAALAPLMAEM